MKALILLSNSQEIEEGGLLNRPDYNKIFDPDSDLNKERWIYYFNNITNKFEIFSVETKINYDTIFVIYDSESDELENGEFYFATENEFVFKKLNELYNESVLIYHLKPNETNRKKLKRKLPNVNEELKAQHDGQIDSLYVQIYSTLAELNLNNDDIRFNDIEIINSSDIIEEVFKIAGKVTNVNHKLEFLHLCLTKNGQKNALDKGYPHAFSVVQEFEDLKKVEDCLSEDFGKKLKIIRDMVLILSDNP